MDETDARARATQATRGSVGGAFGLVIAAGLSTAIGSSFVFCSTRANTGALARALGASAGVMIYVSFAEIYGVKSVDAFTEVCGGDGACGWRYATLCFFCGLVFMYALDAAVHALNGRACRGRSNADAGTTHAHGHGHHDHICIHGDLGDVVRDVAEMENGLSQVRVREGAPARAAGKGEDGARSDGATTAPAAQNVVTVGSIDMEDVHHKPIEAKQLQNMGLMTAVAIGLHNFPEGLATFVAALEDPKLGAALAIAIAIHNIPEGICVAMPVYYASGNRWKGFWWSFFSGLSEPVGAVVGYFVLKGNGMSPSAFGSLFALVAGMMVFISVKELIPTALKYDPHDAYVTTYVFVGMALMALSLVLFNL